jgi:hypothetical protein
MPLLTASPNLDQPRTVDYDDLSPDWRMAHANLEMHFASDRDGNLYNLHWSWHDRPYARSITLRLTAPIYTQAGISEESVDEVMPLVVRGFPGYQETIYGTESGVIVSKRIFAPLGTGYDRAVLWMLGLQAEGDRLLRMEVEIDWGKPLDQRMVDGLLVAQANPGQAQGLHQQQNAESTRIFGTDGGRPDWVNFPEPGRAHLIYHVLVAGEVDLPLILTVSDVGEQVGWNGFLLHRDIGLTFKRSQDRWRQISQRARLWTPSPEVNWAVQMGKEAALLCLRRLRTGHAPRDGRVESVPTLVALLDGIEPEQSRLLLDHLKRLARSSQGHLPETFPLRPLPPDAPPSPDVPPVAGRTLAYFQALARHHSRHPDGAYLHGHLDAIHACAEALAASTPGGAGDALYLASRLAGLMEPADRDAERHWLARSQQAGVRPEGEGDAAPDLAGTDEEREEERVAAAAWWIWQGSGIRMRGAEIRVDPRWPGAWPWWALLDLMLGDEPLSLLWDGETLYTTRPVTFDGPTALADTIRAAGSDTEPFALTFHIRQGEQTRTFRPSFVDVEGEGLGD